MAMPDAFGFPLLFLLLSKATALCPITIAEVVLDLYNNLESFSLLTELLDS